MTQPTGSTDPQPAPSTDTLEGLAASARGWHTIQLTVLGFVGICGVLRPTDGAVPAPVQWLAAALAVLALVIACLALFTVGRVAYPISAGGSAGVTPHALAQARGRLHTGIRLTILALVLIVTAALTGWWPHHADTAPGAPAKATAVTASAKTGQTWCGPLAAGPADAVNLRTGQGDIAVALQAVTRLRPVANCP
ncbi:hypothetical protein ACIQU6_20735 [Streptomyces sp. NPDC090442]|uniref:hypothetical protein n=1 Tax=Streptomyces sp. NPDC090442 TaxID=3365962 RepID=UPI0038247F0B